jgi:phosphoglycerate dehydrogenase-like enzyme
LREDIMATETILLCHPFLMDGTVAKWRHEFAEHRFIDARESAAFAEHHAEATITFGVPDLAKLAAMPKLRWIQLGSAGVPGPLCEPAATRKIQVTNLAGLYGPTIAEHALAMMLILSRGLHVVLRNQAAKNWNRDVADTMRDLAGKTLGIVGLGNIGQNIARLGKSMGMRVVGVRRTPQPTPFVDRVHDVSDLRHLAAESDVIAVAAPLVAGTDGLLDDAFFAAARPGAIYINVSRGPIAKESALLAALDSGKIVAAGLDVFAVEPLPPEHPLWTHPNVIVSPHYSGETVNLSAVPGERFAWNLRNWLAGRPMEGVVRLEHGY